MQQREGYNLLTVHAVQTKRISLGLKKALTLPVAIIKISVSIYQGYPQLHREGFYLRLCKKIFAACGGKNLF
jgi:hypothetical protein